MFIVLFFLVMVTPMANILADFKLTSPDFKDNSFLDKKYTCQGSNQIPQLYWSGVPKKTKSLVLIVDDPDAPQAEPWVHWVVFNIPVTEIKLTQDLDRQKELPNGTRQGLNSFSKLGYDGPCPPSGKAHRYFFTLYALDTILNLPAGSSKKELLAAMKKKVIGKAVLVGMYQKS